MTKQSYKEEFEKIEVPKKEVRKAIKEGMNRVPNYKTKKKYPKKTIVAASGLILAAGVALLALPIDVLETFASIPGVTQVIRFREGSTGDKLDQMGYTQISDVSASYDGITVKIEKTYYDAGELGILYSFTLPDNQENGADYSLAVNQASELASDSSQMETPIYNEETKQFEGTLVISSPEILLGDHTTLPVVFGQMVNNKWVPIENLTLDVPVTQLEIQSTQIAETQITPDGLEVSLDKLLTGKSVSAVEYSVTQPKATIAGAYMNFYREDGSLFTDNGSGALVATEELPDGRVKQIYRAGLPNEQGLTLLSTEINLIYRSETVSHSLIDYRFIYTSPETSRTYQVVNSRLDGTDLLVDIQVGGTSETAEESLTRLQAANNLYVGTSRYTAADGEYTWEEIRDEENSFYLKNYKKSEVLDSNQKILRFTYDTNETGKFGEVGDGQFSSDRFKLDDAYIRINISPDTTSYLLPERFSLQLTE